MDKQTEQNLLNIVKKNYQEIADEFSETRNRKNRSWSELVKFGKQVKKGSSVLDVGCGNGRLLEILQSKSIKYMGVDNSEKLINIAKSRFQDPNVKFQLGDILDLGKISGINFDYVFCVAVLHHIPGKNLHLKALKQLKNKVNKSGKIIITVWNLWSQEKYLKLIFKFILLKLIKKNKMDWGDILFSWKNSKGEKVSQRYYHAFRKGELRRIAKKAGLKVERLYKDQYNYYLILTR